MPSPTAPVTVTHFVSIIGYDDERRVFEFANSWGRDWGDRGFGVLPYDYFSNYCTEAWTMVDTPSDIPELAPSVGEAPMILLWGIPDASLGTVLHGIDLYQPGTDERKGWAFAIETGDSLEVEELYVRPQYRRMGNGRKLLRELIEMSQKRDLRLKAWIPHADVGAKNLYVADRLLRSSALVRRVSGNRWASFKYERGIAKPEAAEPIATTPPGSPGSPIDWAVLLGDKLI